MKTFHLLLLALLMVVGMSQPLVTKATNTLEVDTMAVTTTHLNMRSGPSTANRILRSIPAAGYVIVKSGPHNGAWYAVTFAGTTGFVHGGYLQQRPSAPRLSQVTAT